MKPRYRVTWRFRDDFALERWPHPVESLHKSLRDLEPITEPRPIFLPPSEAMIGSLREWGIEDPVAEVPLELRPYYEVWFGSAEAARAAMPQVRSDGFVLAMSVDLSEEARTELGDGGVGDPAAWGPTTPPLHHEQEYLGPSPGGVGASFAWDLRGGTGKDVRVIDVEHGWDLRHQELATRGIKCLDRSCQDDLHGTAVLGILASPHDGKGIHGLAPEALVGLAPVFREDDVSSDEQILVNVASACEPGTVILLERQARRVDEHDVIVSPFLPLEAFAPTRDAIRSMICRRGVHVVQSAGNGSISIDHAVQDPLTGWSDTGAIVVGASDGESRRHPRSNRGRRVNLYSSGWGVLTAGGKGFCDFWGDDSKAPGSCYAKRALDATSSATAIVGGAVACLSGILRAAGLRLSPHELRALLFETGHDGCPGKSIGRQPDLEAAIVQLQTMGVSILPS
jgi:serine protease